jgi:hypothetical protein
LGGNNIKFSTRSKYRTPSSLVEYLLSPYTSQTNASRGGNMSTPEVNHPLQQLKTKVRKLSYLKDSVRQRHITQLGSHVKWKMNYSWYWS